MGILGKPQGIFDLNDSDKSVGSFLLKQDICEILNVTENDLSVLKFKKLNGFEVIDEREVQKAWYKGEIPNALPKSRSSLDELILIAIIRRTLPTCKIERQIKINRFKLDLKLTLDGKSVFIEFDGPYHFAISRYGPPKYKPLEKKKIIEDITGVEVVNWPYWIQRCSTNVKALFDRNIKGYGALWSTNILFGDFFFSNSAQIIETITKRFNAVDNEGFGYFYGPNTHGRNNPEHPIIEKILQGKEDIKKLLPKGYNDIERWLPQKLIKNLR